MDVIESLMHLQEIDRVRDRLQKRLDEVPVRLKAHKDAILAAERALEEQSKLLMVLRAEADRNQLNISSKEAEREKVKVQMNGPRITGREYTILQEQLAGVLADIGSLTDQGVAGLDRAQLAEAKLAQLQEDLEKVRVALQMAKAELEGSLGGVRDELQARNEERKKGLVGLPSDALDTYERVRRKHPNALSAVDGTIDRAQGRIGNDVHCSACYMGVTSNDAVKILGRRIIMQCKSCMRILYAP